MEELTIKHKGGWEFVTQARGYTITIDVPKDKGGKDKGMTPVELFISSLGACTGMYAIGYCERQSIPYDNMEIKLSWEKADKPARVSKVIIDVKMPKPIPKENIKPLLNAIECCLIRNTIVGSPEIQVNIK